jgi:CubicO group peptidase (beta-lactamase class C family)
MWRGPLVVGAVAALAAAPPLTRVSSGVERLSRTGGFSGVLLVAKDGKPVLERAYGLANRSTREPNRLDTQFNLASIGKTFTGVAVAQLVEHGKVRFSDPVGRWVPELPARIGRHVTVGELLDHTSGLGDYFGDPGYAQLRPRRSGSRSLRGRASPTATRGSCSPGSSSSARAGSRTRPTCSGTSGVPRG